MMNEMGLKLVYSGPETCFFCPALSVLGRRCSDAKHVSNRDAWHHFEKRGVLLNCVIDWPTKNTGIVPEGTALDDKVFAFELVLRVAAHVHHPTHLFATQTIMYVKYALASYQGQSTCDMWTLHHNSERN